MENLDMLLNYNEEYFSDLINMINLGEIKVSSLSEEYRSSSKFLKEYIRKTDCKQVNEFNIKAYNKELFLKLCELINNKKAKVRLLSSEFLTSKEFLKIYIENTNCHEINFFDISTFDETTYKLICNKINKGELRVLVLDKMIKISEDFIKVYINNTICDELHELTFIDYSKEMFDLISSAVKTKEINISKFLHKTDFRINFIIECLEQEDIIPEIVFERFRTILTKANNFDLLIELSKKKNNIDLKSIIRVNDYIYALAILVSMDNTPYKKECLSLIIDGLEKLYGNRPVMQSFVTNVMNGYINPCCLKYIKTSQDIYKNIVLGETLSYSKVNQISKIPIELIDNANRKQIRIIRELIMEITGESEPIIALNMYLVLGFEISIDLLKQKYGEFTVSDIHKIFDDIDIKSAEFVESPLGLTPVINNELIQLIFGSSYKVKNTPIRNMLNRYEEKYNEHERKISLILKREDLSEYEKEDLILKEKTIYTAYTNNIVYIFTYLNEIIQNWEFIEEEFLKRKSKSTLNLKLNLQMVKDITESILNRIKMPDLEARDLPLSSTDIFDYVGYDTKFTGKACLAPERAVTLSREMEEIKTKKFPNIKIKHEGCKLNVLNPQDRNILGLGFKTDCCFRPNGIADNFGGKNSFMIYCTQTEYGGAIEIKDENDHVIMFSPIIRNGNVLMIHSIESLYLSFDNLDIVHELLKKFADEVIIKSQNESDPIDFVFISDLKNLNTDIITEEVPEEYYFKIYDNDDKFKDMYTNLNDTKHYLISKRVGKEYSDIRYGEVNHSYKYPEMNFDFNKTIILNEESSLLIKAILDYDEAIINISNRRLSEKNEHDKYEMLILIKKLKKERVVKLKQLLVCNPNSNLYEEIKKASKYVNEISKTYLDLSDFREIYYGNNWYLLISKNGEIIYDAHGSGIDALNEKLQEKNLSFGFINVRGAK